MRVSVHSRPGWTPSAGRCGKKRRNQPSSRLRDCTTPESEYTGSWSSPVGATQPVTVRPRAAARFMVGGRNTPESATMESTTKTVARRRAGSAASRSVTVNHDR
jgi:hypothetical protein